jgi:hypothetical protein
LANAQGGPPAKAFSIMLGRLQHELCQAYGAEKVMQAIMETLG